MEPHNGIEKGLTKPGETSLPCLWEIATEWMARQPSLMAYAKRLDTLRPEHIAPTDFWVEYIWVVYVSGLSASVVAGMWPRLVQAAGFWNEDMNEAVLFNRLVPVNRNRTKARALHSTRQELARLGWRTFRGAYLHDMESMRLLPMVGPVTCYHLARNLGHDVVNPDIHLARLARCYAYASPANMCGHLASAFGERIGVVDLTLWAYCAAAGTLHLEVES